MKFPRLALEGSLFFAGLITVFALIYTFTKSNIPEKVRIPLPTAAPTINPTPTPTIISEKQKRFILLDVPFTSQSPLGQWSDPRQQDGCEEASSLMAVYWAKDIKIINKETALREILNISAYEEKNYGSFQDTSAEDTATRIIEGYFDYQKVKVVKNISIQDILEEVEKRNLVIVPTNGQILGNPYYTAPGPERHMLVIRGFDPKTNEFITNDNGTRLGELYRYKTTILYNGIRDYPTGNHPPIVKVEKNMIVVWKD
ncbi:MAG: C39 family peptidase [bacterium]|nr:C39 family peptidase [bacterium]